MVKHIILWKLKEEYNNSEKQEIMQNIKRELEALNGKLKGLISIKVQIEKLETSNGDFMLYSTFKDKLSLKEYATHPLHVAVANNFVRPFVETRLCIDFEE